MAEEIGSAPVTVVNKNPLDVHFAGNTPLPVQVVGSNYSNVQNQETHPSIPAKTTFQEDLTTASQRKINLIWEYTQAVIALFVVVSAMSAGLLSVYRGDDKPVSTIISVAFGTVVGFYFSRTNHEKVGGIGQKPESFYVGR